MCFNRAVPSFVEIETTAVLSTLITKETVPPKKTTMCMMCKESMAVEIAAYHSLSVLDNEIAFCERLVENTKLPLM